MGRLSAIFVGLCMGLIAGSLGAVLYLLLGMTGAEASIVALAAFTGLAVYNSISTRARDRGDLSGQIADLSHGTVDLARQVTDLGRRVAMVEAKVEMALGAAAEASQPLAAEIDELASLVNQIAMSVAAHDAALAAGFDAPLEPAQVMPVAPPAPVPASAQVKLEERAAAVPWPQVSPQPAAPVQSERAETDPAPVPVPQERLASGRLSGLDQNAIAALVREALDANRIELHLQPIVMLPQRKVKYYEAFARLRSRDGELLLPGDFLQAAEAAGLMPRLDNAMLFRCVQAVRRLMGSNRDVGLFCNLSSSTLTDTASFQEFIALADANHAIAPAFVFEFGQAAYRAMGPIELESLGALAARGFHFSLDHVGDLRFEPRELAERGFRFIKVAAGLLLGRQEAAPADIHPADLAGLLNRYGIGLIAEKIDRESAVVDLLDYEVKLGQGFLFSAPRPVRPEVLQPANERRDLSATDMPRARIMTPTAHAPAVRPEPASTGLASPGSALAQLARAIIVRK